MAEGVFQITFDPPFNIEPCVEIVSAGNNSQGAATNRLLPNGVVIETFYMHGPNLIDAGNIPVTARATGEYVRILQYLWLLSREMCCTRGYMHEKIRKENWEAQKTLFHMLPVLSDSSCTETILICCTASNANLY